MANEKTYPVAFLIDADNLSPGAIEEAFDQLQRLGVNLTVRRAYGGLEKLSGARDILRKKAVSALLNHGRGTTDVSLVVDAMDLLHRSGLPTTVAIGSSDADFAPLAVRLREANIRVICFAEPLKADDVALSRAYDEVVYLGAVHQEVPTLHPAPLPKKSEVAKGEVAKGDVAKGNVVSSQSSAKVVKTLNSFEDPAVVRRILAQIPGWLPNTVKQLNQLGKPLRESGVKKGNSPLHELFSRHPSYFKVLPVSGAAKQIRLLKNP